MISILILWIVVSLIAAVVVGKTIKFGMESE